MEYATTTDKVTYGEHVLARQPEKFATITAETATLDGRPCDEATLATLNEYFSDFCEPHGEGNQCIRCGQRQCGFLVGNFEWDIAHGHGRCGNCGWPATAYHFLTDSAGKTHRIKMVLQLHPDYVHIKQPPAKRRLVKQRRKQRHRACP